MYEVLLMKVLITGIDGYLGWSLANYLTARGYEVGGIDGYFRRDWVSEMGSWSAIPIMFMKDRLEAVKNHYGREIAFWEGDLRDYSFVKNVFQEFKPDAIVHFGECPSAPYSTIDVHHAVFVQTNNITTTFNVLFAMKEETPDAHLIKLGTMGEYGTPNVDIPEGFFELEFRGRKDTLPFPRQAGSWYHWSKVHGSNNIMFASKIWGLRTTDIMQGIVFGTSIDEMENDERLATRLDFDQAFGTVINRFCCQAVIEHPLTIYGAGEQTRGLLPLKDSMQCLTLAIENPAERGEYRVLNQFQNVYSMNSLAQKVQKAAGELGLNVSIDRLKNPRVELEEHYYEPDHQRLFDLGYEPTTDIDGEIRQMLIHLMKHSERISQKKDVLLPTIQWK